MSAPGPWEVSHASEDEGGCSIISKNGTVAWHVHPDNASVIAAAPELLEALVFILGDDQGAEMVESCAITVNQARVAANAIAKATQP